MAVMPLAGFLLFGVLCTRASDRHCTCGKPAVRKLALPDTTLTSGVFYNICKDCLETVTAAAKDYDWESSFKIDRLQSCKRRNRESGEGRTQRERSSKKRRSNEGEPIVDPAADALAEYIRNVTIYR